MPSFTKLIFTLSIASLLSACSGQPPKSLGSETQPLAACPSSPNCVSSYEATDNSHFIAPIVSSDSIENKHQQLTQLILESNNAQITKSTPRYIRAEYTSAFWGFVDDVEFILQDTRIHMRSASRLGYSDLGVNRDRLESIRAQLKK